MKSETIFLLVDGLIFLILLFLVIRNGLRGVKLVKAMDHFKTPVPENKEDYISDVIEFSQDYSKDLNLHKALQKDEKFYEEEVAKILARELIKNKAVKIEFIQGLKKDTIKGSIRYLNKI